MPDATASNTPWPADTPEAFAAQLCLGLRPGSPSTWRFYFAFDAHALFPSGARLRGAPVEVVEICADDDGLEGRVHDLYGPGQLYGPDQAAPTDAPRGWDDPGRLVPVEDLDFPRGTMARLVADAWRAHLAGRPAPSGAGLAPGTVVEAVIRAARAGGYDATLLGGARPVDLRLQPGGPAPAGPRPIPGEIVRVEVTAFAERRYPRLHGIDRGRRVDPAALGLEPLALHEYGPHELDIDELEGDDIEVRRAARGPTRSAYEFDQVVPGSSIFDDEDAITRAAELRQAGYARQAREMLARPLREDLRCLDAHAHLGNVAFDTRAEIALRHYRMGAAIGELSLPPGFDGLLPWGMLDNRPYLRCLHGIGISLWKLGRFEEAAEAMRRILRLNPWDNQGERFNLPAVLAHARWRPD